MRHVTARKQSAPFVRGGAPFLTTGDGRSLAKTGRARAAYRRYPGSAVWGQERREPFKRVGLPDTVRASVQRGGVRF